MTVEEILWTSLLGSSWKHNKLTHALPQIEFEKNFWEKGLEWVKRENRRLQKKEKEEVCNEWEGIRIKSELGNSGDQLP